MGEFIHIINISLIVFVKDILSKYLMSVTQLEKFAKKFQVKNNMTKHDIEMGSLHFKCCTLEKIFYISANYYY